MSLHAIRRSRGARRCCGVLVLLAFAFKALVPAGFMLADVNGHARLVMCPVGLYHSVAMHHGEDMPGMAGMQHAPAGAAPAGAAVAVVNHAAHAGLAAGQCPFALAGGAALATEVTTPAAPYFAVLEPARLRAGASIPAAPPLRHRLPRGPPALA